MKTLLDAAMLLRKSIKKCKKWEFIGSLENVSDENIPMELYSFFQAQNISVKVVGPTRKTVVSLDMGLYQPAKKLQMARQDLRNIILRPGELHIVMADLRTIGAFY